MLVFCQTDVHDVRTEARVFAMHWCWHSHVPSCPFLLQAWQECREPQTAMFATSQQNCMALGSGFRTKMFGTSKNITRWLVLQKRNTRVGFFFFRCFRFCCCAAVSENDIAEIPSLQSAMPKDPISELPQDRLSLSKLYDSCCVVRAVKSCYQAKSGSWHLNWRTLLI